MTPGKRLVLVTPVLNDWSSLNRLIQAIDAAPALAGAEVHILAVDDGSIAIEPPATGALGRSVRRVQVLQLNANLGHQRAIALGLAYAGREIGFDAAIVMDSDGEDRPEDLEAMLAEHAASPGSIIVARREQRSEGFAFVVFYRIYKLIFKWLTGTGISFGNFSVIPRERINNVICHQGVWNNYAATLLRSRIPIRFVPTRRGARYFGASHMNFASLMVHGLGAISVFSDLVIGRIIIFLAGCVGLFLLLAGAIVTGKLMALYYGWTDYFIPGYSTNVILLLFNLLASTLFTGFVMILSLLSTRSANPALPTTLLDSLVRAVHDIPLPSDQLLRRSAAG